MHELGADVGPWQAQALALQQQGRTVSWLAEIDANGRPHIRAMLAFGDALKPHAKAAIAQLQRMGVKTLLISGDNAGAARAVGAMLGIDDVRAEVLPADKAHAVAAMGGVDDAGRTLGTDAAMHAAGVTLLRGDPLLVPQTIELSRRTSAKIRQNLFWAFAYNVIGIPLAAFGLLSPMLAGAAMALSSVSVVSNALLLKRWRPHAERAGMETAR
jgi:P-type Cu+ transporter